MYATFNHENLPRVNVTFSNQTLNDNSFKEFLNEWDNCDSQKKDYNFYFDLTGGLGKISMKYVFGIAGFIKKKKKEPEKFLKYTVIYVTNKQTLLLLRMVFNLTKPIAPVYIINKEELVNDLHEKIDKNEEIPKEYKIIKFKP
tara:strand:+ start:118 stop:546 length:429 start_codon:yes stop_codon:yes gene_type:complete